MSVGPPWEIFRVQIGGRTVDLYGKNGGYGAYATELVLVPDFNFGFSILSASTLGQETIGPPLYFIMDMIASTVLLELENVARDQANATFAGHYVASNFNSSLTITVDDQPGLHVSQWVSNSTQFLQTLGTLTGGTPGTYTDLASNPTSYMLETKSVLLAYGRAYRNRFPRVPSASISWTGAVLTKSRTVTLVWRNLCSRLMSGPARQQAWNQKRCGLV
jgi:hypothetical protein